MLTKLIVIHRVTQLNPFLFYLAQTPRLSKPSNSYANGGRFDFSVGKWLLFSYIAFHIT